MIAPNLDQQFEPPPGDPVDPPAVDPAPPVDTPPVEPEPDTIDAWRALVASLQAKIAEIETPPDRLLLLKVAARAEDIAYESVRRWYWSGKVAGEKRGGHVFVYQQALRAFLKPLRAR
jgi:hypothetical protein